MKTKLAVIFYYHKTSKYPFNVLGGVLESRWTDDDLALAYSTSLEDLVAALPIAAFEYQHVLVCWSFYSPEFHQFRADLEAVRKSYDKYNVTHIVGGVHATAETRQCLEAGWDLAAVGEGEHLIIDVVDRLMKDKRLVGTPGLAFLDDDQMVQYGSAPQVEILDDSPPYCQRLGGFGSMEITRGCVYACKFCQTPYMFKAKFRHRSVESVLEWLDVFVSRGLKHLRFVNPTSLSYGSNDETPNLDAVEELLARCSEKLWPVGGKVYYGSFPSECRPEHITPEALAILKKYAENDNIIIGGQTGSEALLESSKRGHDVESIRRAVRICHECGFKVNVDFIFGLPGETDDDRRVSLAFADELAQMGARIHGHTFMPLPGTPYKNQAAGAPADEDLEELERMTSNGQLYGQWRNQIDIAQRIAKR